MKRNEKKELLQKALHAHHSGNLDVADEIYMMIIEDDELDFDANHLHGAVLSQNKKYAEAIKYFSVAYENSKPSCELLNNYAIALRNLRAFTECEKMLRDAIKLDEKFANSYLNLSNCYISQEKYIEAIDILERSINLGLNEIKCRLDIVSILFLNYQNNPDENDLVKLKDNLQSLSITKDATILSKVALTYYNINEIEKSLDLFKQSEKVHSNSVPSVSSLKNISNKNVIQNFLKHEYEQIKHIDSDADGIRNMKITQSFYDKLEKLASSKTDIYSDDDYEFISDLHRIKYNKPPKISGPYLNQSLDFSQIENSYCSSNPEVVIIDNFLSKDFLSELQVFFRCSNIFKYPYSRGYIGAFLGKGMANRPLLEFSDELKKTFKKIFKNYYLSQAWAFKYDSKQDGIGIHADDARVNVNFWITDSNSNKNPQNGGLIVWKKTPDLDASFNDFNSLKSIDKMSKEVENSEYIKVPYQSNRVVIFNSKLYHATDKIEFRDNYIDRRVNVTFLYK